VAAYCKPWGALPRWRFTAKPVGGANPLARAVHKVVLTPLAHLVAVHSAKVGLGVLRLQLSAGFNWARRQPTLDYRLTTKWSDGPRFKRKEVVHLSDGLQLRARWNLDACLPDVEGHLGRDEPWAAPYDVDYGSLNFEISQVDAVVDLIGWPALFRRTSGAPLLRLGGGPAAAPPPPPRGAANNNN